MAAIALWELVARVGILPGDYIPPPTIVAPRAVALLLENSFQAELTATLRGWVMGMLLSSLTAIPLGLLAGSNLHLYRASRALVEFLRPIPSVAMIPLAILVFGISHQMKLFLIVYATFWPLFIQSLYGVQDVDPVAKDTARSFGLSRVAIFRCVTLPSAAPYIATGLRLASSIALILAITAELVAGVPGIGRAFLQSQFRGSYASMYALIVISGLLGYLLSAMFAAIEKRGLRWHTSHREVG